MSLSISVLALTGGRIIGAVFGLVTGIVLARLLPKEEYGLYQQVWLIYNTALPFMVMGLPSGVTYFVPNAEPQKQKTMVAQVAMLLALSGLILSAGTYLFADQLGHRLGGEKLSELLRSFFWFPISSLPLLVVDVFLVATRRAVTAAFLAVFSSSLLFAAAIVPLIMGYNLHCVMAVLCASSLLRLILFIPITMRGYGGLPFDWEVSFIRRLLVYSIPLGLAAIMGSLVPQMTSIFVATKFEPANYAIYVVAMQGLPFIGIFADSMMAVVTPEFVRLYRIRNFAEIIRLWHSATQKTALLFFPLAAFLLLHAKDVIVLLYSTRYEGSASIFAVFVFLLPVKITQYGALLRAAGKTATILWIHALGVPICAALCLALMPVLGMAGAALACVLTVYFLASCLLVYCKRLISVRMSQILPWRFLAQIGIASIVAAGVAASATGSMPAGLLRLALSGAVFGAAIAGCLVFAGHVRKEVMSLLRTFFQGLKGY